VIASVIVGVVAAFLQITGVIAVTPVFLWVVFGIAVGYLAVSLAATALTRRTENTNCLCSSIKTLLAGILGSILLATVSLAVGIVATSILSAIAVGLLLFFFSLTLTSTACLVICFANCDN
jgi:hypothetical protein